MIRKTLILIIISLFAKCDSNNGREMNCGEQIILLAAEKENGIWTNEEYNNVLNLTLLSCNK
ncbi:hypothetical protein CH363_17860 [Leptospira haakeii]|uniref:Uncharacterized protein n=1 Tax=Leptospira haakeii TaxID=2023198 RepID=A0ABX4PFS3_9LEPT|nr:hypothetical protein CH363_17860 [Leptospira haakeii]PKA18739.1 hypothetical protein CH377_16395 [Leptospira haakeii]